MIIELVLLITALGTGPDHASVIHGYTNKLDCTNNMITKQVEYNQMANVRAILGFDTPKGRYICVKRAS